MCDSSIPVKRCRSCGAEKPATGEFWQLHKLSKFGVAAHCRACVANPPVIPGRVLRCSRCGEDKPATVEHFTPDGTGKAGFKAWCRVCAAAYARRVTAKRPMPPHPKASDGVKICRSCGEEKTLDNFTRAKNGSQGVHALCKPCNSKSVRARQIAKAALLPPKPKPQDAWKPGHRECTSCKRELPLKQFRAMRLGLFGKNSKCIECDSARMRAYKQANPEKVAEWGHRRRARKQAAPGSFTAADVRSRLRQQNGRCHWCGKKLILAGKGKFHVDHLIPLFRGGSNGPENIVCACPFCNDSKGTKLPHEWTNRLL